MNNSTFRHYLLFAILLFPCLSLLAQPRKLALLVGIDAYGEATGMPPLQVCNGTGLLRQTLEAQGFAPEDVVELRNEQATAAAVRQFLSDHLGQALQGDIVFFHYTGHGLQIPDDNGDESDGLDEALVPFDARKDDPETLLRDDEIGKMLAELAEKAGPSGQVIALIDACHAGGATRGGKGGVEPQDRHYGAGQASQIAFFACLPHERSFQIKGDDRKSYGPLTYAFCRAMQQAGPQTTYRGLYDRMAGILATRAFRQTPEAQGELDRLLFGGRVEAPPAYFKPLAVLSETLAIVRGGQLNGLHPGTEVVLFPVDTRDTLGQIPLATGVISGDEAGLLECRLTLDQPVGKELLDESWIFVRRHSIAGQQAVVFIEVEDEAIRESLEQTLATLPSVHLSGEFPDLVIRQAGRRSVEICLPEGTALFSEPYSSTFAPRLKESLAQHLQARFLRGLELQSEAYRIDMALETPEGKGTVRVNRDISTLTLINRGATRVFYTLIDIDSRDKVTLLLPSESWSPADLALSPGQSRTHRLSFDTLGREVLKLVVTPRPIDLRQALTARQGVRPGRHFFEDLFVENDPSWNGSRGSKMMYKGEEAMVKTLIFEVTE